jgi:[lysine-biosynthesis-protein LysW]--L-2-aminoadipate ligase
VRVALVITDAAFYAGTGFAEAWTRALEAQGASVERVPVIPPAWGVSGPPRYDLAVAHVLVEEVAAFAPTLAVVAMLEGCGVPLTNPVRAIVASSDKLVTHAIWAAAGVPQPATWALEELGEWPGGALVLKPALCDGARHITLVRGLDEARGIVRGWRADEARGGERRGAALLQEWVREPACVRLYATPERTSAAYEKARHAGALITHGTVYPRVYAPPPAMAALARRMVATLGGGLMGVDLLVDRIGRMLALEANAPFGFDVTDPVQGEFVATAALGLARVAA